MSLVKKKLQEIKTKKTDLKNKKKQKQAEKPIEVHNIYKDLIKKKQFIIKSKFNVYRCYSSVTSFCIFIKKILDQKRNLHFIDRNKIINFTSNKILNLENLVDYIKKTGLFKKSKIIFFIILIVI